MLLSVLLILLEVNMKKIFFSIIFLISIFQSDFIYAQTSGYFCSGVNTASDYQKCCTESRYYTANSVACDKYSRATTGGQTPCYTKDGKLTNCGTASTTGPQILNDTCSETKLDSLVSILNVAKCFLRNGVIPIIIIGTILFFLIAIFRFMSATDSKNKLNTKRL